MKSFKSTLFAFSLGLIGFAVISISANEVEEKNIMVQVKKMNTNDAEVELDINGNVQMFEIPELAIGESKEIITDSGSSVLISRNDNGITVFADGEEIVLPSISGDLSAHISNGASQLHTINDGIQVIGDLTDEQMSIVKDAFAAAGVEKEVNFTKGHEMQFFSIDGEGTTIELQKGKNTWLSDDGTHTVIKISPDQQGLHIEKRIMIITGEEVVTEDN